MLNKILTDKEFDFIVELLETESTKLMKESRHTDSREMRKAMRERMRTADRLLERLAEMKQGVLTP